MTEPAPETDQQAARLLREMAELRAFKVPPHDADPPTVHAALRELRGSLDRAEVILASMRTLRNRTAQALADAKLAAEEDYDTEMAELARKAVRLEYQGVKDRTSMAAVKASPRRRALRQAEQRAATMELAFQAVQGRFYGLRDIRYELLATLEHYLPWEASMER